MAKTAPTQNADTSPEGAAGAPLPDSYEAALAELEGLVGRMEGGSLSLEESLAAYRRGAGLVAFCQPQLEKGEQQGRLPDGETLKPLPVNTAGTTAADSGDDL